MVVLQSSMLGHCADGHHGFCVRCSIFERTRGKFLAGASVDEARQKLDRTMTMSNDCAIGTLSTTILAKTWKVYYTWLVSQYGVDD